MSHQETDVDQLADRQRDDEAENVRGDRGGDRPAGHPADGDRGERRPDHRQDPDLDVAPRRPRDRRDQRQGGDEHRHSHALGAEERDQRSGAGEPDDALDDVGLDHPATVAACFDEAHPGGDRRAGEEQRRGAPGEHVHGSAEARAEEDRDEGRRGAGDGDRREPEGGAVDPQHPLDQGPGVLARLEHPGHRREGDLPERFEDQRDREEDPIGRRPDAEQGEPTDRRGEDVDRLVATPFEQRTRLKGQAEAQQRADRPRVEARAHQPDRAAAVEQGDRDHGLGQHRRAHRLDPEAGDDQAPRRTG